MLLRASAGNGEAMKLMGLLTSGVVMAFIAGLARADGSVIASHTELKDCVIQEVLPGKNITAAFVRFVHTGAPVELVRAEVPGVSSRIELHSMTMKDGVMEMARMNNLTLVAGERLFRKGGDHIMLFDIARPPAIGSRHKITVYFSDDTKASCEAVIKPLQEIMRDSGIGYTPAHDHALGHKR